MKPGIAEVKRGQSLLRHSRHLGLESGADLALSLIFLRWELAAKPGEWGQLMQYLDTGTSPQTLSEVDLNGRFREQLGSALDARNLSDMYHVFDYLAYEIPQSEELRVELHALFETVLALKAESVSRAGQEFSTQRDAAALMARLVAGAESVLDPACGEASVLTQAVANGVTRVHGVEIEPSVARLAMMRLALAGGKARIEVRDSFQDGIHDYDVDAVVLEPPFGVDLASESRRRSGTPGADAFGPPSEQSWMHRALHSFTRPGIAVVLMPISSTYGKQGEFNLRTLHSAGHVVAVIKLPPGLLRHTGISTCIWVLSNRPTRDGSVLMIDTSPAAGRANDGGTVLEESFIADVADCVRDWRISGATPQLPEYVAKVAVERDIRAAKLLEPSSFLSSPPTDEELRPQAPVHLLSEVRLKNYKSFGPSQSVPLAPLTLIYGKNSSGKSSIIQSLLLLKQSQSGSQLVTQGAWTDAGSFATAVHRHDTMRSIDIGVSFGSPPGAVPPPLAASSALLRRVDFSFVEDEISHDLGCITGVGFGRHYAAFSSTGDHTSKDQGFSLRLDGLTALLEAAAEPGVHYPPTKKPITKASLSVVNLALKRNRKSSVLVRGRGIFPTGEMLTVLDHPESRLQGIAKTYVQRGLTLTSSVTDELSHILENMSYLGPLRQPPMRYYARSTALKQATELNVAITLFDNISEQKHISYWLKRLGIQYELDVIAVSSGASREIVGDLVAISLTDIRSGVRSSPADVGFGISQVLPILVELSARQQSIVCIEQPEIHLHPALQAEIADVLIESADPAGRGNQVIVETHSEHLILRIQRRVREGSLDPNQVAVVYVDQTPSGEATVQRLRIDSNGDFLDEWPNGFFDDRLEEIFGGM
ncbi:hypothetical protein CQ020_05760 [Arthrobacter sp. MYb23]|uniref:DUF3696 domain-containing protein n=1 Tax=unclassified Arthrobacter TaxID=235627 RepID=UPI000CFC7082|nr:MULTISPECIES: DUF3696 domain-containing protein [unclassified Arthrobacter]PRB43000.1 hypothetical protein CQ038_08390 [Arthrobacter sp. MYb51]PRB97953.1 hypothetical protein CQ020_05760 [Arthrobacter sp. MYb23]